MTKEELDRIKKAYSSGLKVQIWFNGYWEDFDIRDYSMYSEPFSENRQYRIIGSDYVDIAEKRIEELEKENAELKERYNKVDIIGYDALKNLTKANLLLEDVYKIAMEDWNDPKWHDQVLRKTRDYLKEIEK